MMPTVIYRGTDLSTAEMLLGRLCVLAVNHGTSIEQLGLRLWKAQDVPQVVPGVEYQIHVDEVKTWMIYAVQQVVEPR